MRDNKDRNVCTTPFGVPVVPEVKSIRASLSIFVSHADTLSELLFCFNFLVSRHGIELIEDA